MAHWRSQETIGTLLRITVDRKILQDSTVTVRYRDSMSQKRLPIDNVGKLVKEQTYVASQAVTLVVAPFAAMMTSAASLCW